MGHFFIILGLLTLSSFPHQKARCARCFSNCGDKKAQAIHSEKGGMMAHWQAAVVWKDLGDLHRAAKVLVWEPKFRKMDSPAVLRTKWKLSFGWKDAD